MELVEECNGRWKVDQVIEKSLLIGYILKCERLESMNLKCEKKSKKKN